MPTIQRQKTAVLSVSLPKNFRKEVVSYAKKRDISVSQFVKETLKSTMFRTTLEELRKEFIPAFKKLGIKTDEDVEKYFG